MRRILVIEDGDQIAGLLRAKLSGHDWMVDVAANAVAAVNLLWDGDFDLIVIDLGLPGDGALEVVRALHENDVLASVLLLARREDIHAAFSGLDGEPCSPGR